MHTPSPLAPRLSGLSLLAKTWALPVILALGALAVSTRSLAQVQLPSGPPYTTVSTAYNFQGSVAIGDVNGDGDNDVVLAAASSSNVQVVLGDGLGALGTPNSFATGLAGAGPVALGDFNGDGFFDVAVVNRSSVGTLAVLSGDGAGNLSSPVIYDLRSSPGSAGNEGLSYIAVGDGNGDGKPDIIVTSNSLASFTPTGKVWVLLNNGSGGFSVPTAPVWSRSMGWGEGPAANVAAADFDGDGKGDIVVTSSYGQFGGTTRAVVTVLFGNGSGAFPASVGRPFPVVTLAGTTSNANQANGLAVADMDLDGQPDLVVAASNFGPTSNGVVTVFRNTGSRTFNPGTTYLSPAGRSSDTAAGDLNNDGSPDVVVAGGANGGGFAYFLNDGVGNLGVGVNIAGTGGAGGVAMGDLTHSGPGTLDVVVGNFGQTVLLKNGPAAPVLPTQTLTILGGSGSPGQIAPNVEYFNPATGNWQPAFLTGWHPWGFVSGTNSWINYKLDTLSDPGAGPTTNETLWFLYRVRFTVPSDAVNPQMAFSIKADNFAQVAINGITVGGSPQFINHTTMNNVIVGTADQVNADAVFSQNVLVGENTITLNVGDWGGLNGFNFRIDLSMQSSEPLEIIPPEPTDATPPVIAAPADLTTEATGPAGATVSFSATANDDTDGPVSVLADPASGSTFPLGTTVVDLGAADAAGNIAMASFNVTVQDTTPPVITVPADLTAEATSAAGAAVTYPAATATDAVGVASLTHSAASGSTFALGATTVAVSAADAAGNVASASFTVTVQDTTAPTITSVTPSIQSIWPPNKKMVPVTISLDLSDAVGVASTKIVSVATNQPDAKTQWQITGPLTVNLLADRLGNAQDRIYTITVEVSDAAGNVSTGTTTVIVPHDQGK